MNFYGYIRVSTVRQGEHGVSLQEQKQAIQRYAERKGLKIKEWFEEQQTAAKQGRPVFNRMLRMLRLNRAAGVIIHKIDRSARNLKDWALLGELIDSGIAVHFTNDSVDLSSTTGRLSADIQAVVAAHYIRNLKDEVKKGFYGRLKQGVYPMPAPLGYLDGGAGKPKILDPAKAPLMKMAFQLYATTKYSLERLEEELFELGLRSKSGRKVSDSTLSRLLSNPFYMGVIRIKKTGETYLGIHEALVSKELFERVRAILTGKYVSRPRKHDYLFRRLITCKSCGYKLTAETQKGHVYYRCQTKECPTKTLREEIIDDSVKEKLAPLQLQKRELEYLQTKFAHLDQHWLQKRQNVVSALELQITAAKERLNKLTDAYLDGALERDIFEQRKTALIVERRDLEDKLNAVRQDDFSVPQRLREFIELANSASVMYESAFFDGKRKLLEKVTSNRLADGKKVEIMLAFPFAEIATRFENQDGGASRSTARTWEQLFSRIITGLQTATNLNSFQ